MTHVTKRLMLYVVAGTVSTTAFAKGPYTPTQAFHHMYDQVKEILGYGPEDNPGSRTTWLGLSRIGDVVSDNDGKKINDLANTCPELSPMTNFTSLEALDSVYERLIDGMAGPNRPETPAFKAAQALLTQNGANTPEYTKYLGYQKQWNDLIFKYSTATSTTDAAAARQSMATVMQEWIVSGSKLKIDGALFTISKKEPFSAATNKNRRMILDAARDPASFRAPASEVSPERQKWADADGWFAASYSEENSTMNYTAENSSTKGFGGLSLGFLNVVGTGGNGNSSVSSVTKLDSLSYSFELKLITIRRPWLDAQVFTSPLGWTWTKTPNTLQYPHVSDGPNAEDIPVMPSAAVYNNATVNCPIIPTAMVIARKRTLTATASEQDYQEINKAGSSSVGGSFMGIFGGGRTNSWNTTVINRSGNNVTFKIDSPGIGVIGFISTKLPRLPAPNLLDSWPPEAMLPAPN